MGIVKHLFFLRKLQYQQGQRRITRYSAREPGKAGHRDRNKQGCPVFAAHIAVGTPVTGCPPHRSRRAELPHRAPQSYSLCTRLLHLLAIPRSEACSSFVLRSFISVSVFLIRFPVSFASCVALPLPSPCDRLSRPGVL